MILVELAAILLGPTLIPEPAFLSWYLGPKSRASTAEFLPPRSNDPYLSYDSVLGWRSRPNTSRGKWQIDGNGSRSTHSLSIEPSRWTRVLFLGSSLVNGGTEVTNGQTISAYVEDSVTEALNFGTMLYSVDQMYLAYASDLYRFKASVVVVGIPADPVEGLTNRYVPFRYGDQVNMPYLKPRFELRGDSLLQMPILSRGLWAASLHDPSFLDSLRSTDGYFGRFRAFERFDQTPLAAGARYLFERARNLGRLMAGDEREAPLLHALLRRLVNEGHTHGSSVILMTLPDQVTTFPSAWRRLLPDHYAEMVARLRLEGYTVLDGRERLRASGFRPEELYFGDGVHYSPDGNRVLADALHRLLRP